MVSRCVAPLYGWKKANGERRYRKGFITTGKKSAKSTVLSGLPLYTITAEDTQQAEAYTTAVDRNQASIIYRKVSWMVDHSAFADVIRKSDSQKWLSHDRSGSIFRVLTADAATSEGYSPNLLICDELHAWKSREFFNAIMYANIARPNALFLMITTAGDDETSVGFDEYEKAKALLDPANNFYIQDHFAYIAEASPKTTVSDLEWESPELWKEANPSLRIGAIGSVEVLESQAAAAKQNPRERRNFVRYICNRWVSVVEDPWLPPDEWAQCCLPIKDHAGEPAWCGLDLARTQDLASMATCWWDKEDNVLDFAWQFWTPEQTLREHEIEWRVPLRDWVAEGWITISPGRSVNYALIRKAVSGVELDENGAPCSERWDKAIAEQYDLRELRCDPYDGKDLYDDQLNIADGITVVPHRQGYISMNGPSKFFEKLVLDHRIRNGNNPVVNWMAAHCVAPVDAGGSLIKPNKKKSRQKIDGLVAAVMAAGGAMASAEDESVYQNRGPLYVDD